LSVTPGTRLGPHEIRGAEGARADEVVSLQGGPGKANDSQ